MTIRKNINPAYASHAKRGLLAGAVLIGLSGCGMINSVVGTDKVDYKSAKKASTLDVPPDLTQLQKDNRYTVPDVSQGVATASGYNAKKDAAQPASGPAIGVMPGSADVKVERAGNQRWLVVNQSPETLWPKLKSFWEDTGFTLDVDLPAAGIMETEWNENRAKLPQDFIRETLGKVFDSLYSTGERDKFRTRLERLPDGSTEIYLSHRGVQEVLVGNDKERTVWTARPNDPGLEAMLLARLMVRLGNVDNAQAKSAVDNASVKSARAKLVGEGAGRYVEVDEGFDRAWRRVGLALDRVGFTVEDRDRSQGLYFVRYVDPDQVKSDGFLSKLLSWGSSDADAAAQRYRIAVKGGASASSNGTSAVSVLGDDGKADGSPTAGKILSLLGEQLK